MGGSYVGNIFPGLRPCGSIRRMGVYHTADFGKCFVEHQVGGGVGRGFQRAVYHFTVQVHYHHIVGFHRFVGYTAGFNDYQITFAINGRYVSPCENDESVLHQFQIGTEYFFFEFF